MLIHGDCLEELKQIPSNSLDALITDPPAGISFMGKGWDKDKGGRDHWIAWMQSVMVEVLRVLKPGAHGLVWALPRTSHWTATALENAGFEIRDSVVHIFGSGFPKSTDISKQIDKKFGAEREIVGSYAVPGFAHLEVNQQKQQRFKLEFDQFSKNAITPQAKQWQGYGTALKPAHENWLLVRKPLGEKTVAKNVLEHGTGALNIDASRIGVTESDAKKVNRPNHVGNFDWNHDKETAFKLGQGANISQGRFPANLVLSHHPECELVGTKKVKPGNGSGRVGIGANGFRDKYVGGDKKSDGFNEASHVGEDGTETIQDWQCHDECAVGQTTDYKDSGGASRFFYQCHPDCAVKALNDHSGPCKTGDIKPGTMQGFGGGINTFGKESDKGKIERSYQTDEATGAARFFYCSKASRKDRGATNSHPTVKSTKVMEYLIKLITPPNGRILDPFAGSTLVAAQRLGFDFVGIEQDESYFHIASERINSAV